MQWITRERINPPSTRRNVWENDNALPLGTWVVWWYGRLVKNAAAETVPLVEVTLQKLNGDLLTGEFETIRIAVSRLLFYPRGLILEDRRPVARIAVQNHWFDVEFSYSGWNFFKASDLGFCSPKSEYRLPESCSGDWSLAFKQVKGTVLLNCVDYLVRGYAHRSEIPRILTTYSWGPAKHRLLAKPTPADEQGLSDRLIVYPHPDMVSADETFLAYLANDSHTIKAARSIFADADTQAFKSGQPHTLQVMPWFKGRTRLQCRGIWLNKGQDFLCLELLAFDAPQGKLIDCRISRRTKTEAAVDDWVRSKENQRKLTENDMDFCMTDFHQPRSPYPRYDITAGELSAGVDAEKTRTYIDVPYERTITVPSDQPPPDTLSTGDTMGRGDSGTAKATVTASAVDAEFSGALQEMWKSFLRLRAAGLLKHVRWYAPHQAIGSRPPELIPFSERSYDEQEDPKGKLKKWLYLHDSQCRGMMIFVLWTSEQMYLVIETERRRWTSKDGDLKEESCSGLICQIENTEDIRKVHRFLDNGLPSHKGVFANLVKKSIWPLDGPYAIYPHRTQKDSNAWLDAAAVNALRRMGIVTTPTPRKELIEHSLR